MSVVYAKYYLNHFMIDYRVISAKCLGWAKIEVMLQKNKRNVLIKDI